MIKRVKTIIPMSKGTNQNVVSIWREPFGDAMNGRVLHKRKDRDCSYSSALCLGENVGIMRNRNESMGVQ